MYDWWPSSGSPLHYYFFGTTFLLMLLLLPVIFHPCFTLLLSFHHKCSSILTTKETKELVYSNIFVTKIGFETEQPSISKRHKKATDFPSWILVSSWDPQRARFYGRAFMFTLSFHHKCSSILITKKIKELLYSNIFVTKNLRLTLKPNNQPSLKT